MSDESNLRTSQLAVVRLDATSTPCRPHHEIEDHCLVDSWLYVLRPLSLPRAGQIQRSLVL